jgi:hypothetical protein
MSENKGNCALCHAEDVEVERIKIYLDQDVYMVICKDNEHANPGCPHGRYSWKMCPWCLGINNTVP